MIWDWLAVILILILFSAFLSIRTVRNSEKRRPGTFALASIQSLFLWRLGILRIATNGGAISVNETNHDFFIWLGSSPTFFGFLAAFTLAYVWHSTEENKWVKAYDNSKEDTHHATTTDF